MIFLESIGSRASLSAVESCKSKDLQDFFIIAPFGRWQKTKLDLNAEILKEIDKEVGDLDIGDELSDRERFKSKWSALEKLVGNIVEPQVYTYWKDAIK
jgi:hypothetical protein